MRPGDITRRSLILLLVPLGLAFPACSGVERSGGPAVGPMDHTTGSGMSLDETRIRILDPGRGMVGIPLEATGDISAQVQLDLVDLTDGSQVSSGSTNLTTERGDNLVQVTLSSPLPEAEDASELARYVLDYRVLWDQGAIWGSRSLFVASQSVAAQLVGPATLQTGVSSKVRVITTVPSSGEPAAHVPVTISLVYGEEDDQREEVVFQGRTGDMGEAVVDLSPPEDAVGDAKLKVQAGAAAKPVVADVRVERPTRVMLTTDKPIYKPGQVIHMRALALLRPDLRPDARQDLVFEVFDAKDNKLDHIVVRTDDYGVAAADFQLAKEVNRGRFRITAGFGDAVTEKSVTVDYYSLPKFDLDVDLDQEVYLAGSRVSGTIRARYFFGEPLPRARVVLTASTLDAGETVFWQAEGLTNQDGLYRFELTMPQYVVGLPLEQGGGLVRLTVEVTDTAGQSRSVEKTVRVARGPIEVVVVPESGTIVPGLPNRFLVKCTDASGAPLAARHTVIVEGQDPVELGTGEDGRGSFTMEVEQARLVMTVQSEDAAGERVSGTYQFDADPAATYGGVLLRTDQALYHVGDTMEITVLTAGARDRVYLDVIRGGQTALTKVLEPDLRGRADYRFTLSNDLSGALELHAYYLAQGSSLRRDRKLVYVEPADQLVIEARPDREVYAPGEEARMDFVVTDEQGQGRAAALGLQVVDEAVFGLVEFKPGLEKSYFQIEAELGQPRYQIGVPSLPALVADPDAPEDPSAQSDAQLLFAATDVSSTMEMNTYLDGLERAAAVARPLVQTLADQCIEGLSGKLSGSEHEDAARELVSATPTCGYDPWGRAMTLQFVDDQHVRLTSLGPDEVPGTLDDLAFDYDLHQVMWGPQRGGMQGGEGEWEAGVDFDDANAVPGAQEDGGDLSGGGGGHGDRPRVRRNFPETLFVEPALITDGSGRASVTIPLADSITTWRMSVLGNSADGLLGSTDQGIRVFQDFFVDIQFPGTLTRGDEYSMPVAVYNYLDEPQTVRLEIEPGGWFSLLGPASVEVHLGPGEVGGVRMPIRVDQVGLHELTVYAYGSVLQDAVARKVLVEPDGHMVERVTSGKLDGPVTKEVTFPDDAIPGSQKLLVKLYPGLFSQVVEGLDSILRMPTGCFEQTSSSTWPNVLVTEYMRETGTVSPEIDLEANQYINTGYQRLLTFEVDGGGFEWFGRPPAHVVLTAYGLLEFMDMARVRPVDRAMIERTRAWLLAQQEADGHWEVASRGLDETGNLDDPVTVTAYVAFSLAAAGQDGEPMTRAMGFLRSRQGSMGTYTLALFTNFMVAWRPDDPLTTQLLDELAQRVERAVGGGDQEEGSHWETDEQTTTYGRGIGAYIETTALATHALLEAGAHYDVAQEALDWLVTKKQPSGGWGSTAGTVWTIKCMLAALAGGRDEQADATVTVALDGEVVSTFEVTPANSDVLRLADLSELVQDGQTHRVEVHMQGEGRLQYGIVTRYHEPWDQAPEPEGPLSIEVSYDRTHLEVDDMVTVTVRVTNTSMDYADMVMVDLGIPPGFDLVRQDLDDLVAQGVFSKYEHTERQLLLYFTVIRPDAPKVFSYGIVARDPIRAQAPRSRVYSYYNPEVGSETEPVDIEVQ